MPKLYSYVIARDNGAAPNPFWGVCTLVICKPQIRISAEVGDWIIGTGSASSEVGDIRGYLVYAMKVTEKLSMRDYDAYAHQHLPEKVLVWKTRDPRRRVGDAICDFSTTPPTVRQSVHNECKLARDLRGQYALLSEHFYYFGDRPIPLPSSLLGVAHKGQGHSADKNAPYIAPFLEWLTSLKLTPNQLYGKPAGKFFDEWQLGEPSLPKC